MLTKPDVTQLRNRDCPKSDRELEEAIRASGAVDSQRPFDFLRSAIDRTEQFFQQTLPFVWTEALSAASNLPDISLLQTPGKVTLTQRECLCVLANAFLCTFTERISNNCLSGPDLPSIHFDEMYGGYGLERVAVAKLRMLFNYFEQCRQRISSGDLMGRPIHTIRRRSDQSEMSDWEQCANPLTRPVVHPLGESIDDAKDMLRVDFANRIIGGGTLAYGCVQEEIMFCVCPELIVTRLFCPVMQPDEAIVVKGAEQFSIAKGYAAGLEYGGPYQDQTPIREDGALASYVVAIDALDFRGGDAGQQYAPESVLRELTKAWAAFGMQDVPNEIATGNWGCGVFGGDAALKSILQWLAIVRSGKVMHYFPWDNEEVQSGLPDVATMLVKNNCTVGEVCRFLFHRLKAGNVYEQLTAYAGND